MEDPRFFDDLEAEETIAQEIEEQLDGQESELPRRSGRVRRKNT